MIKGIFTLGLAGALVLTAMGEENSAQRLENAQRGVAEGSWPRRPDNRLSPLSGKMKENREISMRYYGQGKEFRAREAHEWGKESALSRKLDWEGATGQRWQETRWVRSRDWKSADNQNEKFQPGQDFSGERMLNYRELDREVASGWASRPARLTASQEGSLRMYEGRLTRVREQVRREEAGGRDLGPGRQEKFSPQEVERVLENPLELSRGAAREQSPAASPLAAAGN